MIYERTKMMNNQNQGKKIPVAQVPDTTKSHQVDKKIEPSTFAPVRNSKTQPIQSLMDADLYEYTGDLLELDGLERQESVDKDSGEVHVASLYTVKIIQKKAKATLGSLLTIKVKNSEPILDPVKFAENQLDDNAKKIVVRFDNLAHYTYIGGESINSSKAEIVPISVKEASRL